MKVLEHWGLPPELVEKVMSVHAEQRLRAVHRKKMHQTLGLIENGDIYLKHRKNRGFLEWFFVAYPDIVPYCCWRKWCKHAECWTYCKRVFPTVGHTTHAQVYAAVLKQRSDNAS